MEGGHEATLSWFGDSQHLGAERGRKGRLEPRSKLGQQGRQGAPTCPFFS